jgi:nucleotide-binding universal stress UspA family protein
VKNEENFGAGSRESDRMIKKILFATDGSENSRKAMEFAVDMIKRYDAIAYLLHVVPKSEIPMEVLDYVQSEDIEDSAASVYLDRLGKKIMDKCELEVKSKGCGDFKTIVVRGNPADMILEIAKEEEVDAIIMGSRGLGAVKGALLGSVSRKVANMAECVCIIVK